MKIPCKADSRRKKKKRKKSCAKAYQKSFEDTKIVGVDIA